MDVFELWLQRFYVHTFHECHNQTKALNLTMFAIRYDCEFLSKKLYFESLYTVRRTYLRQPQ